MSQQRLREIDYTIPKESQGIKSGMFEKFGIDEGETPLLGFGISGTKKRTRWKYHLGDPRAYNGALGCSIIEDGAYIISDASLMARNLLSSTSDIMKCSAKFKDMYDDQKEVLDKVCSSSDIIHVHTEVNSPSLDWIVEELKRTSPSDPGEFAFNGIGQELYKIYDNRKSEIDRSCSYNILLCQNLLAILERRGTRITIDYACSINVLTVVDITGSDMFDIKTDVGNFSFMAKHPSTKLEFISAYNKVSLYEAIIDTEVIPRENKPHTKKPPDLKKTEFIPRLSSTWINIILSEFERNMANLDVDAATDVVFKARTMYMDQSCPLKPPELDAMLKKLQNVLLVFTKREIQETADDLEATNAHICRIVRLSTSSSPFEEKEVGLPDAKALLIESYERYLDRHLNNLGPDGDIKAYLEAVRVILCDVFSYAKKLFNELVCEAGYAGMGAAMLNMVARYAKLYADIYRSQVLRIRLPIKMIKDCTEQILEFQADMQDIGLCVDHILEGSIRDDIKRVIIEHKDDIILSLGERDRTDGDDQVKAPDSVWRIPNAIKDFCNHMAVFKIFEVHDAIAVACFEIFSSLLILIESNPSPQSAKEGTHIRGSVIPEFINFFETLFAPLGAIGLAEKAKFHPISAPTEMAPSE